MTGHDEKVISMIKYTAKPIEDISNGKGCWNSQKIGIFQQEKDEEPVKIGEYLRNYSSFMHTFFPFRHENGKWYALYSPDYTATRVMELPSCKDIGGEEPNGSGFCPMDYYVPTYIDFKYTDHEPIRASQIDPEDLKNESLNTPDDIRHWHFGFVSGCIWGDDWSEKIEYLDLSEADKGIIKRSAKFGYIWLPNGIRMKDAIDMDCYDGHDETMIRIATSVRFFTEHNYDQFDASDITDLTDMRNDDVRTCPECHVNEGTAHADGCKHKNGDAPYIFYPRICRRCGKINPSKFHVNDEIWKRYVPHPQDDFPLCLSCFLHIKSQIDAKQQTWSRKACPFCGSSKLKEDWQRKTQPFSHICEDCGSGWW